MVERDTGNLPADGILIHVQYSSLNYKDALSVGGNHGMTCRCPYTPSIDTVGMAIESLVTKFAVGDEVTVTGYDLNMDTAGGFGQYIRASAARVIEHP